MGCIHPAHGKEQCRAFVNTVMKFRVLYTSGKIPRYERLAVSKGLSAMKLLSHILCGCPEQN
jgi:hypothetical protein